MVRAELYVRQNEATSRLVFIHAYTSVNAIPFELEANAKVRAERHLTSAWYVTSTFSDIFRLSTRFSLTLQRTSYSSRITQDLARR
jgi:hypothetical protein